MIHVRENNEGGREIVDAGTKKVISRHLIKSEALSKSLDIAMTSGDYTISLGIDKKDSTTTINAPKGVFKITDTNKDTP